MKGKVDTIIFDAGGVLLYINEFRDTIIQRVLLSKGYSSGSVKEALARAKQFDDKYFSSNALVNWDDEKQWLLERARIISTSLEGDSLLVDQLYHLAFDTFQYHLYNETKEVLENLKGKYRLFVLSNATATLDWSFDYLGIRQYFEQIMISSYERCEKPNQEIYELALSRFDVTPATSLFIDDKVENVVMAMNLGIQGYHLQRSKGENLFTIENLLESC